MTKQDGQMARPVFVGGIGGSGTRVIAALLRDIGYNIGADVNASLDNLWFTALFKHHAVLAMKDSEFNDLYTVFRSAISGIAPGTPICQQKISAAILSPRKQHSLQWLKERETTLFSCLSNLEFSPMWAWKEPNSHIHSERIMELDSEIRYIHLTRSGLDMAYSPNQNQLEFWGDLAKLDVESGSMPAQLLSYWCWAERKALELREKYPNRILWICYDDLFHNTEQVSAEITQFLDISSVDVGQVLKQTLEQSVSIGRFREFEKNCFREDDLQFVASLGFPV